MFRQTLNNSSKIFSISSSRSISFSSQHKLSTLIGNKRALGFAQKKNNLPIALNGIYVRYNSTGTSSIDEITSELRENVSVFEPTFIPPVDPTATIQIGDFAALGLCNYTPVGLLEKSMELLAVTGLPWYGIIPLLTISIRFLSLPLIINMNHATTRMNNIRPDMEAITNRLKRAQKSNDAFECQVQSQRLQELFKKHKIKPLTLFIAPLVQAPIMISFFLALRAMAEAKVPGLADGGLLWFTDLTASDPYYILPVLSSMGLLATLELSAILGPAMSANNPSWVRWAFRAIALVSLPATASLPAAVFVYWIPSNIFSIFQTFFLNVPRLRKMLGLPVLIKHPPPGPAVLASQSKPKSLKQLLSA